MFLQASRLPQGGHVTSRLGLTVMIRIGDRDDAAVAGVGRNHGLRRRLFHICNVRLGRSRLREGVAENDHSGEWNSCVAEHFRISWLSFAT